MRRWSVAVAAAVIAASLLGVHSPASGSISCAAFTRLENRNPHGYADGIAIHDGDTTTVGRKIKAQDVVDVPGADPFVHVCWTDVYFNGPETKPYVWATPKDFWVKPGIGQNFAGWEQNTLPGRNMIQVRAGGLVASFTWYGA